MKFAKLRLNTQDKSFDYPLVFSVIALVLIGLIMVYESSLAQALKDFGDGFYYIKQQLVWAVVGSIVCIFFANFNYQKLEKLSLLLILGSTFLLLAVFIPGLGTSAGGAQRWLSLGFITVQPAEIIKLTSVIYLASVFKNRPKVLPMLVLTVFITAVTAILQKDLGSSVVFVLTVAIMYFSAGASLVHFLAVTPLAALGFLLLVFTSDYRKKRIFAFLDPFSDTQGFTYHISQVLIALGSGGIFGVGLGQSKQKFEYIPEVSTDSIFAIIGEEFGLLGSIILIGLILNVVIRGLKIAEKAPDNFGKILAVGLTSWLGVQAVVNLSSMVALVPLTGVPLPFISYGGSALVANLTAAGILLNISRQR